MALVSERSELTHYHLLANGQMPNNRTVRLALRPRISLLG